MIIIYSLVLLSISTINLAMEKAGKPLPPNPLIAHYCLLPNRCFPAAKSLPPQRIPLTVAERSVFLNAKKLTSNKKNEELKPENISLLVAQCNSFKNNAQVDELLNLHRKFQDVHWWTIHNLSELSRLEPHLQLLTQKHSVLTCEWQHESQNFCCKLLEYKSDLIELSNQFDVTLSHLNLTRTHEEYMKQLCLLHRDMYLKNSAIEKLRSCLVDKLTTDAHQLEPLDSTQQIKEKVRAMDQTARQHFISQAIHTLEEHYETYAQVNKAARALQTLLRIPLISKFEESNRFSTLAVLKRLRTGLTQKVGVAIIKDVTHLPIYKKEVHACNPQQIQNIRKTHQYSIQFRIQDSIVSSDRECKSEILYFFSKGELLNQHELADQIKPTTSFVFKSTAADHGFCVANQNLHTKMITESLWHIGQDYYFVDHTKGSNFYKVELVAALNLPQQKSTPAKIQP